MDPTHVVENQAPPLEGYDMVTMDPVLAAGVEREGAGWALGDIVDLGMVMSSPEVIAEGFAANQNPPVLHTHDRYGNRSDVVDFHPSWHSLMTRSIAHGLHSLPWEEPPGEGAYVARVAKTYLVSQIEAGHWCPISMTCSV
ncbi:MAG: DNA alkylation response protein, partial [Acidimicrobiia bacterium]